MGDFWAFEEFVTSAKMNLQTDRLAGLNAENAYKTLAASLGFENGDSLAAEDYTSAGGAKGTVNIGSTNAIFATDKYTLLDVFNLASASYDSITFPIAQDSDPTGIFFKPDGLKMYVAGANGDRVYQYTLGTAWDLSTSSYDSVSFSVVGQQGGVRGLFFKDDGSKMFIIGSTQDVVTEYSLGTPWVVSSAVFTVSFSIASQTTNGYGLSFKDDGLEMYITGVSSVSVHQYTLSTAWDISSASITSGFNVSGQMSFPTEVAFNNDGSKMYVVDGTSAKVFQYTLSTAWDITTASYDSIFFTLQDSTPYGLFFKDDGAKMYSCSTGSNATYQYSTGAGAVASGSKVVCDDNTLPIDDETNSFCLHWQGDFPTANVGGSFNLKDGVNTLNLPVNTTTKKTELLNKDTLTNVDDIIVEQVLTTTDSNETPTAKGFGIVKL